MPTNIFYRSGTLLDPLHKPFETIGACSESCFVKVRKIPTEQLLLLTEHVSCLKYIRKQQGEWHLDVGQLKPSLISVQRLPPTSPFDLKYGCFRALEKSFNALETVYSNLIPILSHMTCLLIIHGAISITASKSNSWEKRKYKILALAFR